MSCPYLQEDIEAFFALLPPKGVLIALDVGRKRIGLAASTRERRLAVALPVFSRQSLRVDLVALRNLFVARAAVGWVVGLPLSQSGKESAMSVEVRIFAEKLLTKSPAPLLLFDERFTSALVERVVRVATGKGVGRGKSVDSGAATLLLQNCLEASKTCKG